MKSKINADELLALRDVREEQLAFNKPHLGFRYALIIGMLLSLSFFIAVIALVNPAFFMAELISPSIIPTDKLVANTQIRGAFTLILITASLASHFVNLKITHVLLVGALLWTTAITMIDLYKLFTLSIFTATTASTIYLILRPVIFIFLVILIRDLGVYLKALQRQG